MCDSTYCLEFALDLVRQRGLESNSKKRKLLLFTIYTKYFTESFNPQDFSNKLFLSNFYELNVSIDVINIFDLFIEYSNDFHHSIEDWMNNKLYQISNTTNTDELQYILGNLQHTKSYLKIIKYLENFSLLSEHLIRLLNHKNLSRDVLTNTILCLSRLATSRNCLIAQNFLLTYGKDQLTNPLIYMAIIRFYLKYDLEIQLYLLNICEYSSQVFHIHYALQSLDLLFNNIIIDKDDNKVKIFNIVYNRLFSDASMIIHAAQNLLKRMIINSQFFTIKELLNILMLNKDISINDVNNYSFLLRIISEQSVKETQTPVLHNDQLIEIIKINVLPSIFNSLKSSDNYLNSNSVALLNLLPIHHYSHIIQELCEYGCSNECNDDFDVFDVTDKLSSILKLKKDDYIHFLLSNKTNRHLYFNDVCKLLSSHLHLVNTIPISQALAVLTFTSHYKISRQIFYFYFIKTNVFESISSRSDRKRLVDLFESIFLVNRTQECSSIENVIKNIIVDENEIVNNVYDKCIEIFTTSDDQIELLHSPLLIVNLLIVKNVIKITNEFSIILFDKLLPSSWTPITLLAKSLLKLANNVNLENRLDMCNIWSNKEYLLSTEQRAFLFYKYIPINSVELVGNAENTHEQVNIINTMLTNFTDPPKVEDFSKLSDQINIIFQRDLDFLQRHPDYFDCRGHFIGENIDYDQIDNPHNLWRRLKESVDFYTIAIKLNILNIDYLNLLNDLVLINSNINHIGTIDAVALCLEELIYILLKLNYTHVDIFNNYLFKQCYSSSLRKSINITQLILPFAKACVRFSGKITTHCEGVYWLYNNLLYLLSKEYPNITNYYQKEEESFPTHFPIPTIFHILRKLINDTQMVNLSSNYIAPIFKYNLLAFKNSDDFVLKNSCRFLYISLLRRIIGSDCESRSRESITMWSPLILETIEFICDLKDIDDDLTMELILIYFKHLNFSLVTSNKICQFIQNKLFNLLSHNWWSIRVFTCHILKHGFPQFDFHQNVTIKYIHNKDYSEKLLSLTSNINAIFRNQLTSNFLHSIIQYELLNNNIDYLKQHVLPLVDNIYPLKELILNRHRLNKYIECSGLVYC